MLGILTNNKKETCMTTSPDEFIFSCKKLHKERTIQSEEEINME